MTGTIIRARIFLLLAIVVLLLLAGALIQKYTADFPPSHAELDIDRGTIWISHDGFIRSAITVHRLQVNAGDTLDSVDGWATLHFTDGVTADLFPGSKIRIDRFGSQDSNVQLGLSLLGGELIQHVFGQTDRRSWHTASLVAGGEIGTSNGEYVALVSGDHVTIGTLSGTVTLKTGIEGIPIATNTGLVLRNGKTASPATAWGTAHVIAYRPNGTSAALPVTMTADNQDQFAFSSDRLFALPSGNYALKINTIVPYALPSVTVFPSTLNEWPITLSEVAFNLVDSAQKPLTAVPLVLEGIETLAVGESVLVAPGTIGFRVAREDASDQWQTINQISALPGQHLSVPLRNDLFGGGNLTLTMTAPDGTPQPLGTANVYADGSDESGSPSLGPFKTDGSVQVLPKGKYVVVAALSKSIGVRLPIDITTNKTTALTIPFGTLNVNFTDVSGRSSPRLVYIVAAKELLRLKQTVDQMRQTIYGIAINTGVTINVPAGDYVIRTSDPRSSQVTISIFAGQNSPINLTANGVNGAPSTS